MICLIDTCISYILWTLWIAGALLTVIHNIQLQIAIQDPVGTVLSTELPADYHHNIIIEFSVHWCVEGRGRISRSCLIQDIQMGSCVFQCDVPHQWIAQRQVGPVSVYCDGVGCHVLCLRHGIPVWQHIGQSITATSRHRRDMTLDV